MNELLRKLSGGDLRSDGRASEVADDVLRNPKLINMLVEGLSESDDVIRGRTAHALERISRTRQDLLREYMPRFIELAVEDKVPMVRWHLAMIFGNMTFPEEETDLVVSTLSRLLKDESAFVRSWAISGLCLIGRRNKSKRGKIARRLRSLRDDKSVAVRTRAAKALDVLENESKPIPETWSKTGKP